MSGAAWDADAVVASDRRHCWHPFTQMGDWCAPGHDVPVIVEGRGAMLLDARGREYIDGNSSIWTNLHGHRHPAIDGAIREQLGRIAHSSFLGSTNPVAVELAERLAGLFPEGTLTRVFFSDDGSTAVEVAAKIAVQYWQQSGHAGRDRFLAFDRGYHGDTAGASSLGGIDAFHGRFRALHFPVCRVASAEGLEALGPREVARIAAVVLEPLVQGAAGMRLWPAGMLRGVREWCDRTGVLLILDEVMTGFGRTGSMFACERERVVPDMIALAKGLTGGYLPLAATLVREGVYGAFLGAYEDRRALCYGHSYTGNALGCAAALANLRVFREEDVLGRLRSKIALLGDLLGGLAGDPRVGEVRQCGFIAGIELMADRATRRPHPWEARVGARVCMAARRHGLLTRPIGDVVILMPPYCIEDRDLARAVGAIRSGMDDVLG